MAKLMNPNTTIWWVPEEGIVDGAAITVTELTGANAVNLSAAVVTGFTLNPTDSDTDDSRSIVDEGNVENPTWDNYEANLTFFRTDVDAPTGGNDEVMDQAYELFKAKGARGWLVRRIGKKYTVAPTATDVYSAFKVLSDNPQDIAGGDEGPIQLTVPFFQQGEMHLNKTLVAGGV